MTNRAFCHHETMSTRTLERTRLCFDWDFGQQNQSQKGAKLFLAAASVRSGKLHLRVPTLLIFSLQKLEVFTVSQIPLQFHCIFYRQPTVNMFLQFLHSTFALFVCKKCSETAVGFVPQWKPVVFAVQILAVYYQFLTCTWFVKKWF